MAAPVFRADGVAGAEVGGRLEVRGPNARHAVTVTRVRPGDALELVDGDGARARCTVLEAIRPETLVVSIDAVEVEAHPNPRIIVVQALVKGDRSERALETLTEVGVDEIVPWQAERSIVRWDGKVDRAIERWRTTVEESAKQARRARIPVIGELARLEDVVGLLRSAELGVVLHEDAAQDIGSLRVPRAGAVVVVVGPEGGLTDAELALMRAAGGVLTRLGPTVLRAATAGTVAAAVLLAGSPRWRHGPAETMQP